MFSINKLSKKNIILLKKRQLIIHVSHFDKMNKWNVRFDEENSIEEWLYLFGRIDRTENEKQKILNE